MTQRERILVSACLLGEPCRYDGKALPCEEVMALAATHDLVPACPEVLGGLPTPRTPSEITANGRVVDREGNDRTAAFASGACTTVEVAQENNCSRAILKSRSPSCGVDQIYDGTFTGTIIPGEGFAAAALRSAGLQLADETSFYDRFGLHPASEPAC